MELSLTEAEGRLPELVTAAQRGERVVITKNGDPAVELVHYRKRGRYRPRQVGGDPPAPRHQGRPAGGSGRDDGRPFTTRPLSRKVLGLDDD